MPRSARIMRRAPGEVNGSRTRARHFFFLSTCALLFFLVACNGTERRAERLWRHALDLVAKGDTSGAVVELQRILDDSPAPPLPFG